MGQTPTLHMLYTCPFCWKVRGVIEHLGMEVEYVSVNGMKIKKDVAFAGDWGKVPVFTDQQGDHHVDSTPLLRLIDATYNDGKMAAQGDPARQEEWLTWADTHLSKATVPILYGSLGSALSTTRRISKVEKFNWFSKRLYAWAGFPVMWGIIAKKRVKADGRRFGVSTKKDAAQAAKIRQVADIGRCSAEDAARGRCARRGSRGSA